VVVGRVAIQKPTRDPAVRTKAYAIKVHVGNSIRCAVLLHRPVELDCRLRSFRLRHIDAVAQVRHGPPGAVILDRRQWRADYDHTPELRRAIDKTRIRRDGAVKHLIDGEAVLFGSIPNYEPRIDLSEHEDNGFPAAEFLQSLREDWIGLRPRVWVFQARRRSAPDRAYMENLEREQPCENRVLENRYM